METLQTENPNEYRWQQGEARLTLQATESQGTYIGTVLGAYCHLCNQTYKINPDNGNYVLPPTNACWTCTVGLIPCPHGAILQQDKEFCILVQLLPRITYHTNNQILDVLDGTSG